MTHRNKDRRTKRQVDKKTVTRKNRQKKGQIDKR